MPRDQILYAETYRAPGLKIKSELLPTLPSATQGFEVYEAYVLKAGRIERADGRQLEFQDVRIYLRELRETE